MALYLLAIAMTNKQFTTGTQSKNSPVSIEEGWTWLVRLGKSLTHAVERRKEGDTSVSSLQCQECCTALYLYLRQGSAALIAHYGWQTVLSVFKAVRTVIVSTSEGSSSIKGKGGVVLCESESGKQLVAWVDAAIATDGVKCAEKLKHHEPHVMASYMVIRYVPVRFFTVQSCYNIQSEHSLLLI